MIDWCSPPTVCSRPGMSGTMLEDSGFDSLLEAGLLDAGQTARRLAWAVRTRKARTTDDLTVVVVRRVPEDDPDQATRTTRRLT